MFENSYNYLFTDIYRWHLTEWNECSKTCGNGSHSRLLYCRKQTNDSHYEQLHESSCNITTKPMAPLFQHCNEVLCPAEWKSLPWSEVNAFLNSLFCQQLLSYCLLYPPYWRYLQSWKLCTWNKDRTCESPFGASWCSFSIIFAPSWSLC